MSKNTPVVHVLIPYTTKMACGKQGYATAFYREGVTCRLCKETTEYKDLDNVPKKFKRL